LPSPSQGYNVFFDILQQIQDEGIDLTFRPTLNFIGAGVTAVDDPGNNRTNVDIPGAVQTPHDLLDGLINQDTVANTPTAGSLIFGDLTPLWNELLIGTPGQVLTAVGGLPVWATLPADVDFYQTIQDEGIALPQQPTFNFIGAIVTAVDDPGNNRTNITIAGGGGGGTFILGVSNDGALGNGGNEFNSFFTHATDGTEAEATGFLAFAITVNRVTVHVGSNSSSGITDIAMRDDSVDVPNTVFNIPSVTTGSFDSGAISEAVASFSLINLRLLRNGTATFGDYSVFVEVEK
jgi:hypothetical protein